LKETDDEAVEEQARQVIGTDQTSMRQGKKARWAAWGKACRGAARSAGSAFFRSGAPDSLTKVHGISGFLLPRYYPGTNGGWRPDRAAAQAIVLFEKPGAGERIRTVDPNLGN
jgi:hypothetical protein